MGRSIDAKNVIEVMMLAAGCGSEVEFLIDGDDADECSQAITRLITLDLFPMDAHRTLRNYVIATGDRSADSLAALAFSNNDLRNWYTKTQPERSAHDIATALSVWVSRNWPMEKEEDELMHTAEDDQLRKLAPNKYLFVMLVTARLEEVHQ